ncbi:MAG: Cof-type HAD-IIB family hydrolase [Bifidobacteriaceae bacterium]|nr:Cof-type HAD-IIB family hydrolase [Bifidobacteriaceae bacterium]
MHNTKIAFFDIDGTLTSFNTHTVPQSTIRALQALQNNNILISICTGRGPSQVKPVLDLIPIEFDVIVSANGQYCYNQKEIIHKQALDVKDVEHIVQWLDEHPQIRANFCEENYTYLNHITEQVRKEYAGLGKTAGELYEDNPHTRIKNHETLQISPFVNPAEEQELLQYCHNVQAVRWVDSFADILPPNGGKHAGIQAVLNYYGFTKDQAIAFGDGGNDMTMLDYVGTGVAMGNANPILFEHADFVTKSVDEDGIEYALKTLHII